MLKVGGFAELLPEYKILEEDMLDIIKKSYRKYGYTPIETPAMEKTNVLSAKGGGEVKNQIFGVYGLAQGSEDLKDYSLRFDLTVPFSRYVLDYRGELAFPFKRSAVAKVWRGERQQRGRSKEFYQADIDVIWDEASGKDFLFYDAEVISVAYKTYLEIFEYFKLDTQIRININNRKIVSGFIDSLGLSGSLESISIIIDKIEKISKEKFEEELQKIGLSEAQIEKINKFTSFEADFDNLLGVSEVLEINNEEFKTGINELYSVLKYAYSLGIPKDRLQVNLSIIRGLAYYTGTVFETFIDGDRKLGSIGSGGRYEKLTTYIDPKTNFSGVGFSIGVTRMEDYIFENIEKNKLAKTSSEYLIINFEDTIDKSLELYSKLIFEGKKTEFYPESDKLAKQFKYADKKGIKYCVILGTGELEKGIYTIKNMQTGESEEVTFLL